MSHNKLNLETVLGRFQLIHGDKFSYHLITEYTNTKFPILIHCLRCEKSFKSTVSDHLQGKGCPYRCRGLKANSANNDRRLNVSVIKQRINTKFNNPKIDWSKAVYVNNKTKMELYCLDHNEPLQFFKNYSDLSRGRLCPICGMARSTVGSSYTKENFISLADKKEGFASFYLIKGYDFLEEFYKFGITTNDLKTRFGKQSHFPYRQETILLVKGSPNIIWEIEQTFKSTVKESKFIPSKKFAGSLKECFSTLPDMSLILKHKFFSQVEVITNVLSTKEKQHEND